MDPSFGFDESTPYEVHSTKYEILKILKILLFLTNFITFPDGIPTTCTCSHATIQLFFLENTSRPDTQLEINAPGGQGIKREDGKLRR